MLEILLNNFDNNSYFDKGLNYYLTNEDDSNLLLLYGQSNINQKSIISNRTIPISSSERTESSTSKKKIKSPNTYPKPNYKEKTKVRKMEKSVSYESYFNC